MLSSVQSRWRLQPRAAPKRPATLTLSETAWSCWCQKRGCIRLSHPQSSSSRWGSSLGGASAP